jgi:hypothetical protein
LQAKLLVFQDDAQAIFSAFAPLWKSGIQRWFMFLRQTKGAYSIRRKFVFSYGGIWDYYNAKKRLFHRAK